ncbi:MAG: sarcinarray family MAST domain-containing protein [Methanosarcinaceae archaeon]
MKVTVIEKTHFDLIDGPVDINWLTLHIFETNETHTFEWTLKPTDEWAGGTIPVNIHYTIYVIDEYDPLVNSGFTIAYPYISTEYYEGDSTPPHQQKTQTPPPPSPS